MGGGKGGGAPAQHEYYGTVCGVVHCLQADHLVAVYIDSDEIWRPNTPVARASSANPYQFDIEGYGRCYFFWGTADQTLDSLPTVVKDNIPEFMSLHGNMRHMAFLLLVDFRFGVERLNPPNIEVVTWRKPVQTVVTGAATNLDAEGQCNPVCALAEILSNPIIGGGRPLEGFEVASWQAMADYYAANPAKYYLSPNSYDSTQRSVVASILDHIDGWIYEDDAGQLVLGRFAQGNIVAGALPAVTLDDLVSVPEWESYDWGEVTNLTEVNYVDRDRYWKDASCAYNNGHALKMADNVRNSERYERPFIRRRAQAIAEAARLGAIVGQRYKAGTLDVRASRASALIPGALFRLNLTPTKALDVVCRVTKRSGDASDGMVSIEWESERGRTVLPYQPPAESFATSVEPVIPELVYWHLLLLPARLITPLAGASWGAFGKGHIITALAGRTDGKTIGAELWFKKDSDEEYQSLGKMERWAVPVKLADDYADSTADLDNSGTLLIEKYVVDEPLGYLQVGKVSTQTPEQYKDDWLLLIIFSAADDTISEIMTIRIIGEPTDGEYPLYVIRNRFGPKRSFTAGDPAYITRRSALSEFRHRQIDDLMLASTTEDRTASFKLQPYTRRDSRDLADCDEKEYELTAAGLDLINEPVPVIYDATNSGPGPALSCRVDFPVNCPAIEVFRSKDGGAYISQGQYQNIETDPLVALDIVSNRHRKTIGLGADGTSDSIYRWKFTMLTPNGVWSDYSAQVVRADWVNSTTDKWAGIALE